MDVKDGIPGSGMPCEIAWIACDGSRRSSVLAAASREGSIVIVVDIIALVRV